MSRDRGRMLRARCRPPHPDLATVVRVEECYLHRGKALIRSGLWNPDAQELSRTFARDKDIWALQAVAKGTDGAETLSDEVARIYRSELY